MTQFIKMFPRNSLFFFSCFYTSIRTIGEKKQQLYIPVKARITGNKKKRKKKEKKESKIAEIKYRRKVVTVERGK